MLIDEEITVTTVTSLGVNEWKMCPRISIYCDPCDPYGNNGNVKDKTTPFTDKSLMRDYPSSKT